MRCETNPQRANAAVLAVWHRCTTTPGCSARRAAAFGERGEARREREGQARSVCRACPVRTACAAFAVRTGEPFGIWGGLTEADRDAARSG
ncbi:WhiB family transcriptional regulator [Kitasatospora sp. NPDC017646]|uniref:WhiB family transcriptional regulator n=1 Tax=Kitasatospora sp. NPDC017646 TaxID=3364024 RepID=UPI0037ACCB3D